MMKQYRHLCSNGSQLCALMYHCIRKFVLLAELLLVFLSFLACQNVSSTNTPHLVPMPTDTPVCLSQRTPVIAPTPTPQQKLYNDLATRYFSLVLHKNYQKAYSLLSIALRVKETYSKFLKDSSYVLSTEGWMIYQIVVSQQEKGETSWNIGIELEVTQHGENKTIWYDWNMHMRMEHGHLVIVQLGLYPTEVSC